MWTLAPLWEQPRFQVPLRSCRGATFWTFLPPGGHPGGPKDKKSSHFACACHAFQGGWGAPERPTFLHRPGTKEAQKRLFLLFGGYHFGHLGAKLRPPGPNFSVFLSFWGICGRTPKKERKKSSTRGAGHAIRSRICIYREGRHVQTWHHWSLLGARAATILLLGRTLPHSGPCWPLFGLLFCSLISRTLFGAVGAVGEPRGRRQWCAGWGGDPFGYPG